MSEINPDIHLAKPKGATHFRLTAGAALISLEEDMEDSLMLMASSPYQPLTSVLPAQVLSSTLPGNAQGAIMLVFGISFYQEVNSVYYTLNNGAFNALGTVAIDTP